MKPNYLIATLLLVAICSVAQAEVTLPSIFSDHMVLQQGVPIPIWGWANPGEQITVSFAGQTKSAQADKDRKWSVTLDKIAAAASQDLTVKGQTAVNFRDVLIGEVWLCAGDATMAAPISQFREARKEMAETNLPAVRVFRAAPSTAKQPQADVAGAWVACDRKAIGSIPAIPWFFAKEIAERRKSPVGIIIAAHDMPLQPQRGGKIPGPTVESFISLGTLQNEPAAFSIIEYYRSGQELREATSAYNDAAANWKLRYGKAMGEELHQLERREPDLWYDYVRELQKAGKSTPPLPPQKPTAESLNLSPGHATNLYNAMIVPLARYAIRGFAWSQGASNAPRATQYRKLLPLLILDWRNAWGAGDIPFVYLQQRRTEINGMDPRVWAELRESQAAVHVVPQTAMAVTIDLPMTDGSLMPQDPQAEAVRLSLAARSLAYAEPVAWTGPAITGVTFDGATAIAKFSNTGDKLAPRTGALVKGFALAAKANRWVYADARIEGDTVIVTQSKVTNPIALRYDRVLEPGMEGNLINAAGLPALPYRSDDWGGFTERANASRPNAEASTYHVDLYPVSDPTLPRVLLIGDSIMNGYAPYVVAALKGKANVNRQVSGTSPANAAMNVVPLWHLDEGDYAVIHYNDGLHSMPPRESDSRFESGLRDVFRKLQTATHAKVIWATITPAPDGKNTLGPDSWNPSVLSRNALSKYAAADAGIAVDDLYELVIARREQLQGFGNLHFTPEGSKLMGEQVAAKILEALNQKAP